MDCPSTCQNPFPAALSCLHAVFDFKGFHDAIDAVDVRLIRHLSVFRVYQLLPLIHILNNILRIISEHGG